MSLVANCRASANADTGRKVIYNIESVSTQAIKVLLSQCRAVDVIHSTNDDGDSLLHLAARSGNKQLCQLLLENGANPLKRNKRNRTPAGQSRLDAEVKEYMSSQEELAKELQKQKRADVWNEKMRATQTQNACGVGVL